MITSLKVASGHWVTFILVRIPGCDQHYVIARQHCFCFKPPEKAWLIKYKCCGPSLFRVKGLKSR